MNAMGGAGFVRNRSKRVLVPLLIFWPIVVPLTGLGLLFAASRVGGPMAWDLVRDQSPLRMPVFGHLWFLYDLLLFYAAALLIVPLTARLPAMVTQRGAEAFRAVVTRRWGVLVLAGVTTITLLPMRGPTIETSAALAPPIRVLAAYGVFFTFGWLLYVQRELVDSFAARWRSTLVAGMAATFAYIGVLIARRTLDPVSWHISGVALDAVAVWLLTFGITGAFVRYLSTPRPLVRYFSDASYWMYLLHVVPITFCAGLLARSGAPAFVKFGIVLGVTIGVTMLTYHYFVRSTRIGVLLNGRRLPPGLHHATIPGESAEDREVRGTPVP